MSQAETSDTTSRLSRRSALAGLSVAAVAGVVALPAIAAQETDPILAVIAKHKEAVTARMIALNATYGMGCGPADEPEDAPTHVAAEEAHDEASDREWEAFDRLFVTLPTTIGGVIVLLDRLGTNPYDPDDHAGESVFGWAIGNQRENANQLLRTLAAALRKMSGGRS
jgi:hypothetical protein